MTRYKWLGLGLIVLVGLGLRLANLNQPMRYDEALSYLTYIRQGPEYLLSHYEEPNNHVGHSLIVYFSSYFFPFEEWAIRLPAFLFGVGSIVMAFLLGRSIRGDGTGLVAGGLVALSPHMVLYSTNARGYQMVSFFVLWIAYLLLEDRGYLKGRGRMGAYIFAQVYGMFTIPTMLYASMGFALYLGIKALGERDKKAAIRRFFGVHLTIAAGVLLLYLPIIIQYGFGGISDNRYTETLTWEIFGPEMKSHVVALFLYWADDFNGGVLWGILIFSLSGLVMIRDKGKEVRWLALSLVVAVLVVTLGKRVVPFVRTWQYAYVLFLVYGSVGVTLCLERIKREGYRQVVGTVLAILLIGATIQSYVTTPIVKRRDTGAFAGAPAVVNYLKTHFKNDIGIITGPLTAEALGFYAEKLGCRLSYSWGYDRMLLIVPDDLEETFASILFKNGLGLKAGAKPEVIDEVPDVTLYLIEREDFDEPRFALFPELRRGHSAGKVISAWYGEFGAYYYPWIEHESHGWQQCLNEDSAAVLLYDAGLDKKVLIEPASYPRMKILSEGGTKSIWVEWEVGTKTPDRRFKNLETGEWIEEGGARDSR